MIRSGDPASLDLGDALRVPAGRLERATRWGMLAGSLAAGAIGEGLKGLARGATPQYSELLFNGANAERLVKSLGRMRGAAMKLGQAVSLELDGVVPAAFADVMSALQATGNTMTETQLRRVLGQAYGHGWQHERFAAFDERPFAAASIGQVHRATARDGRELAIKVQFPGVARSIGSDVENLATLFRSTGLVPSGYDLTPLVSEVRRGLEHETDYLLEAESLARYRDVFADDARVRIPEPHLDLTTSRVLAMEYIDARPIRNFAAEGASQAARDRLGSVLISVVLRELLGVGFMQSDPNFANFMVDDEERLVCLDLGAAIDIDDDVRRRITAMIRAGVADDVERLMALFREFGWVGDEPDELVRPLAELVRTSCEPLRARGRYDFGASNLDARARELGMDLVLRRGMRRPPPPELVFVNRKLGGTFLLAARLGARVPARRLTEPYLEE